MGSVCGCEAEAGTDPSYAHLQVQRRQWGGRALGRSQLTNITGFVADAARQEARSVAAHTGISSGHFPVGAPVEAADRTWKNPDGTVAWKAGVVTCSNPLKVRLEGWETGYRWDHVRPRGGAQAPRTKASPAQPRRGSGVSVVSRQISARYDPARATHLAEGERRRRPPGVPPRQQQQQKAKPPAAAPPPPQPQPVASAEVTLTRQGKEPWGMHINSYRQLTGVDKGTPAGAGELVDYIGAAILEKVNSQPISRSQQIGPLLAGTRAVLLLRVTDVKRVTQQRDQRLAAAAASAQAAGAAEAGGPPSTAASPTISSVTAADDVDGVSEASRTRPPPPQPAGAAPGLRGAAGAAAGVPKAGSAAAGKSGAGAAAPGKPGAAAAAARADRGSSCAMDAPSGSPPRADSSRGRPPPGPPKRPGGNSSSSGAAARPMRRNDLAAAGAR
eukprot:TRINITY_DN6535_c1_g1_i1.p1 TRINITY_DN6535_c1_g1~~TRINITY_DN6535_c1_g1_i1.p1  ORF type:complete len:444 (+),score=103.12 TRINITY_DN6535_c1_g1_i1:71-1402(+)